MKKTIINILILIILSYAIFAASSSGTISLIVPERYTLSFSETNGISFLLDEAQTSVEVGQLSIGGMTNNPLQFMFYCSNNSFLNSNIGYLVLDGGSIDNASDRLPYSIYFSALPGALPPDNIPNSAETAASVSGAQNSNKVVFSVKSGYFQGMNIVFKKADMKKARNGIYSSEITLTIADT
ncbi:MAG: hypothetical protein ABIH39_07090 [Candidatus Margulisiibacteriota bacterium]